MQRRKYRQKKRDERAFLLRQLADMEAHVRATSPPCPEALQDTNGVLSWQVIAQVFRAASGRAKGTHKDLIEKTVATSTAIHNLMRFLEACHPCPMPSLSTSLPTMQFVTLPANAEARTTAKQWLTQQLYHNTDRAFSLFPHDHDLFVQTEIMLAESHVEITERSQIVVDLPLSTLIRIYFTNAHRRWLPVSKIDCVEIDGNTRKYHSSSVPAGMYFNVLEGHFHEAERCVLVIRYLQDDDRFERMEGSTMPFSLQWSVGFGCVVVMNLV
ncbi:Aste57867_12372 [Aphanomyces stellatus]|uniref:Aste57867_12372 protein n=1 Tax=Aphanomyces stellatus TaxID=120398 RepID=A0A485KVT3_9STRA|nr:hypothetical protein As57867_012326 [Aphanomyces stellatus]VFT89224.1 Aste57867_12372 [Aphanomyces stellatus]